MDIIDQIRLKEKLNEIGQRKKRGNRGEKRTNFISKVDKNRQNRQIICVKIVDLYGTAKNRR